MGSSWKWKPVIKSPAHSPLLLQLPILLHSMTLADIQEIKKRIQQVLLWLSPSLPINYTCYQYTAVGKYCTLCVQMLDGANSFVYTSGHCRRWRSRMEVKIMAGSVFVHCKIAYFYSVTTEKSLVVSLPNFVTIRRTHFSISCKIFSWIRSTKLKIHAMEFCDFIKDSVSPSGLFVPCSLTVTSTWRPRLTAHCPIGERH